MSVIVRFNGNGMPGTSEEMGRNESIQDNFTIDVVFQLPCIADGEGIGFVRDDSRY